MNVIMQRALEILKIMNSPGNPWKKLETLGSYPEKFSLVLSILKMKHLSTVVIFWCKSSVGVLETQANIQFLKCIYTYAVKYQLSALGIYLKTKAFGWVLVRTWDLIKKGTIKKVKNFTKITKFLPKLITKKLVFLLLK